eukprot:4318247-Alexandrium_andersonii.AAC.1
MRRGHCAHPGLPPCLAPPTQRLGDALWPPRAAHCVGSASHGTRRLAQPIPCTHCPPPIHAC